MTEPMRLHDLVTWVDPADRTHRRLFGVVVGALAATTVAALAATSGGPVLTGCLSVLAVVAWGTALALSRRLRDDYRSRLHIVLFVGGGAALLVTTLYGLTRGLYPSALFEDPGYTVLALTAAALLAAVGAGLLGEVVGAWLTLRGDPTDPEEVIARILED